jgi:CRP/FNR family transcriptional regulator, anaerobic regulatory protein
MNNTLQLAEQSVRTTLGQTQGQGRSPGLTMLDLLQVTGAPVGDAHQAAQVPVLTRRVHAGESLVHEGSPAEAIFFVCAGTFKVFCTDVNGYEQILSFALRGEVLGFDALCMESHPTAITALEDSSVFVVLRNDVFHLSQVVPAFSQALQRAGSLSLVRSRDQVGLMAAVASEVRLARFLIQLSQRMAHCGQSPRRFHLRMGRRELASLLGVAHETVSRSFTALASWGLIEVSDREVEIRDMDGLQAFARSTRRPAEGIHAERSVGKVMRRSMAGRRQGAVLRLAA